MNKRNPPELPELLREASPANDAGLREVLAHLTPGAEAPPGRLRERLLSSVAQPRLRFAPLFGALADLFDLDDTELASLFERAAVSNSWLASRLPGTQLLHLRGGSRVADADNGLVRISAGARFPSHRHLGLERVVVLEGGYTEEPSGRLYLPGDLHEMPAGSTHAYTALPGRELLLAVSVVSGVDVEGFGRLSPSAGS
jgi:quercetin dioxygenase-like cupin family protein